MKENCLTNGSHKHLSEKISLQLCKPHCSSCSILFIWRCINDYYGTEAPNNSAMDYEVQRQTGLLKLWCLTEFTGLHEVFLSFGFRRLLSIAAALQ